MSSKAHQQGPQLSTPKNPNPFLGDRFSSFTLFSYKSQTTRTPILTPHLPKFWRILLLINTTAILMTFVIVWQILESLRPDLDNGSPLILQESTDEDL